MFALLPHRAMVGIVFFVVAFPMMAGGSDDRSTETAVHYPIRFVYVTAEISDGWDNVEDFDVSQVNRDRISARFDSENDAGDDGLKGLGFFWIADQILCKLWPVGSNSDDHSELYANLDYSGTPVKIEKCSLTTATNLMDYVEHIKPKNVIEVSSMGHHVSLAAAVSRAQNTFEDANTAAERAQEALESAEEMAAVRAWGALAAAIEAAERAQEALKSAEEVARDIAPKVLVEGVDIAAVNEALIAAIESAERAQQALIDATQPAEAENALVAAIETAHEAQQALERAKAVESAAAVARAAAQATVAEARVAAAAAVAEAQRAADAAVAEATKEAYEAKVSAIEAGADAAAAQAQVQAMIAAAFQPSEVVVSASELDPTLASTDHARLSLAGPDAIYISNILYDGVPYSALLRYRGGTSLTVEGVYGPRGKLIPDSVSLSQVELDFVAPATIAVSNVEVSGVGYSGTLGYAGGNQLRVIGIRQVTLPPTEAEAAHAAAAAAISQVEADAAAAVSKAQAAADAAGAEAMIANTRVGELETKIKELTEGIPLSIDPALLDLESARASIAGPNSVYISGIRYTGEDVSARVRFSQGTGTAEAVFASTSDLAEVLDMNAAEVELAGNALVMSNVGIRGRAHTLTLTFNDAGGVDLAAQDDGWAVRTGREFQRDTLITEGTYVVNGFTGGQPLAKEGAWSESAGSVVQTDSSASHAKFTIPASQSGSEMLFGVTARASEGKDKVGFGMHFLASDTPVSGNTWNYGRSYLIWATRDPFYDNDTTHLQLYESRDNNTMAWLASRSIEQSLSVPLTLEALYQSNGMMTLFVGGEEQLSLHVGTAISAGDRIALRSQGGPVEFIQVYIAAR